MADENTRVINDKAVFEENEPHTEKKLKEEVDELREEKEKLQGKVTQLQATLRQRNAEEFQRTRSFEGSSYLNIVWKNGLQDSLVKVEELRDLLIMLLGEEVIPNVRDSRAMAPGDE